MTDDQALVRQADVLFLYVQYKCSSFLRSFLISRSTHVVISINCCQSGPGTFSFNHSPPTLPSS